MCLSSREAFAMKDPHTSCRRSLASLGMTLLLGMTLGDSYVSILTMIKKIVYPGTFDPITHGHVNLVERASHLFDQVVVAIATNPAKTPLFSLEQRVAIAREIFLSFENVSIASFSGLLVDFMQEHHLQIILRGIRGIGDMEYEFQMAGMNQMMDAHIETLFLKSEAQFASISSTIVREIARMGGDISLFVPPKVVTACNEAHPSSAFSHKGRRNHDIYGT